MNEALVKNIFQNPKSQFNDFKNSSSVRDKTESSFDTYLNQDILNNNPIKKDIPKIPKQYSNANKIPKKEIIAKSDSVTNDTNNTNNSNTDKTENQQTSETHSSDTPNKSDNHTVSKDISETIADDETLGLLNPLLIALTETIAPLPSVIHHAESDNITLLNNTNPEINALINSQSGILPDIVPDNIPILTEFLKLQSTEKGDINETEFSDSLLGEFNILGEAIDTNDTQNPEGQMNLENFTLLQENNDSPVENEAINFETSFQPNNPSEVFLNILQNTNNSQNTVTLQKATQLEIVAQMPLQNDMSVNITKDPNNDNKIGINLEPAGMGTVELTIETNPDNAVTAVIRSDKPEILEQLRKESASLERYLTEAGLNLGGNGLGFEHKNPQENPQENNNESFLNAKIAETALHSESQPQMTQTERLYAALDRQSMRAGLDIRL